MSDGDALLATIRKEPNEDTPRLAYADWLDENDQPQRAKFIRAMIGVEELRRRSYHARETFARKMGMASLTPAEARAWSLWPFYNSGGLAVRYRVSDRAFVITARESLSTFPPLSACVRRGFVYGVRLSATDFFHVADSLRAEHPLQFVHLTTLPTTSDLRDEFLKMGWPDGAAKVELRPLESQLIDMFHGITFRFF